MKKKKKKKKKRLTELFLKPNTFYQSQYPIVHG